MMLRNCMLGHLSIVATPIGNLQDLTERAKTTLASCDLIVCEDTRVTSKLLTAYHISKPLRAIHEHSAESAMQLILRELKDGKHVAYVSDAGTPGVNDPGGKLVELALNEGIRVEPIPGASALSAAISVCGFPMDEFVYLGFAPHKKGRQTFFQSIASDERASIFFESTHRIEKTLDALASVLQEKRLVCVGRELTKMHETIYRGTIDQVRASVLATSTKGEFVIIVASLRYR